MAAVSQTKQTLANNCKVRKAYIKAFDLFSNCHMHISNVRRFVVFLQMYIVCILHVVYYYYYLYIDTFVYQQCLFVVFCGFISL